MTPEDRLTTLGLLWAAWERQGRVLSAEQWQRPTRLGDWTVRMLYARAASWPVGSPTWSAGARGRIDPYFGRAVLPPG